MHLYLVQHGEAKTEAEDPERGLTERGIKDVTAAARFGRDHGIAVNMIHHSGKKRAGQTAEIFADYMPPKKGVHAAEGLSPMDDPAPWAGRLATMTDDVMLVGHLPFLARLASLALCGSAEKRIVDFKMAGIVCLKRIEDGSWTLAWSLPPELVR